MGSATIGVRDLFIQELKTDTETEVKYGQAERLALAINLSVTPKTAEASQYADDRLSEYYNEVSAYDLSFEVNQIDPLMKAKILGYKVNEQTGQVLVDGDSKAPYFGVSFRSKRSDGTFEYRQLFKVRFAPTEDSYSTQGEKLDFQTRTVTGKAMPLLKNGAYETFIIGNDNNKDMTSKWNDNMFTELSVTPSAVSH